MKPNSTGKATTSKERTKKCLHFLQPSAVNKEILVGGGRMFKSSEPKTLKTKRKSNASGKKKNCLEDKKVKYQDKAIQIGPRDTLKIEAKDLTIEERSENYWEILAETRLKTIIDLSDENEYLKEDIEKLQKEFELRKHIEIVLKEIIEDNSNDKDDSLEETVS